MAVPWTQNVEHCLAALKRADLQAAGRLFSHPFVLPPGGHTAPDVALGFVFLQNRLNLPVECAVQQGKTLPEVLMYGRNKKERLIIAIK